MALLAVIEYYCNYNVINLIDKIIQLQTMHSTSVLVVYAFL